MDIYVLKRDGSRELYNANLINQAVERVSFDLTDPISKVTQVASETELTIFDGITTEQLDQALINTAVQNIKDDPEFDTIASRLYLKLIYKNVLGDFADEKELVRKTKSGFVDFIHKGIQLDILDKRFETVGFDLQKLAENLDHTRDFLLKYIGLVTMTNRYALKDHHQTLLETPQFLWMRIAMGLSLNEKDPTNAAIDFYHRMSKLEYLAAGSTLVNAGTIFPQLSNCFLMEMQDDLDHIGKSIVDVMKLTKGTGGIGLGITKLRANGSPIHKTNTFSTGPIPFMHTIDSVLRAVSRGGKKFGALCFYMENWHLDFPEFLDLKENSGDPYRRLRTANTAVWISDEFMKRVRENQDWYLFDPQEVPDLNELYGEAFSRRYNEYIQIAEQGKMRIFKKIKARELFKSILISLQTTSHPWLTWKDTINNRALNNNTGTIHLSNLCTEICLPQDKENIAVCNLASINLSRHLIDGKLDWEKLEESVRSAIRQLDNLIDITISSVSESERANSQNRAVGLGIMGFTDLTERLGFPYESEKSYQLIDQLMEFISYMAIDESTLLARERGAYPNFKGSRWSKGILPIDTITDVEKSRDVKVTVNKSTKLDWESLRKKVKKGMRNATLLAVAPTASIGLVAGTTPGMDPQFSQIFSRATSNGKFLEININLVNDLKRLGLWEEVKDEILEKQGDISTISTIPNELKQIYKTSFEISPYAFIEVAAQAQKWIDQSISRNMYLETRDIDEMIDIYSTAWEKGLKTTYYLHMKPRHTAEQSTTKVNKAASIVGNNQRFGFGSIAKETPSQDTEKNQETINGQACPIDPQERLQCESCQ